MSHPDARAAVRAWIERGEPTDIHGEPVLHHEVDDLADERDGLRLRCAAAEEQRNALRARVAELEAERDAGLVARPRETWTEDDGCVLWWTLPVCEPPYVGTELDDDFPDYVTHWTPLVCPDAREDGGSDGE